MSFGKPGHPFFWVVSYPKSGNTWVRHLLRYYIEEVYDERPSETNDTSLYWYMSVAPKPLKAMESLDTLQLRPAALSHMMTVLGEQQDDAPCSVVKSHHLSGEYFGVPFFSALWVDKAIYITRDPRDILPSFADHTGTELEEQAERMADGAAELGYLEKPKIPQMTGTWSQHVTSWINQRRVESINTSYEELHEDAERELEKMVEFLELREDAEAVEVAVERASFENLRKKEEEEGFCEASEKQDRFFRRGEVGSHEDEVPLHLEKKIIEDHGEVMRALGYLDE